MRVRKTMDEKLFTTVFADAEMLPINFPKSESEVCKYNIVPHRLNMTYMHNLFLTEIAPKEPLKRFKEMTYLKKAQGVPNGDVRDRKARVQQQFDDMDLEMNVHILWILTWAATLSYQDDDEKPFRLK